MQIKEILSDITAELDRTFEAMDEAQIEELEREDAAIDSEFERPEVACDPVKCTELGNRKEKIASRLEELYMIWEELSEE